MNGDVLKLPYVAEGTDEHALLYELSETIRQIEEELSLDEEIARVFRAHLWRGVMPVEQAIEGAIFYRRNLAPEERAAYDEAILAGWAPWQAAEAVEIMAGRQTPGNTGSRVPTDTPEETAAKVGR